MRSKLLQCLFGVLNVMSDIEQQISGSKFHLVDHVLAHLHMCFELPEMLKRAQDVLHRRHRKHEGHTERWTCSAGCMQNSVKKRNTDVKCYSHVTVG